MKITHAMKAARGLRTFTIVRHEGDTYSIQMLTEVDGEEPIAGGCTLSREALELLAGTTSQFLQNIDKYEVSGDET